MRKALTLCVFAVLVLLPMALCGCTVGKGGDGQAVIGFPFKNADPASVADGGKAGAASGSSLGTTIGGIVAGPAGASAGGAIGSELGWILGSVLAATGVVAAKRHGDARAATAQRDGERAGWDERESAQSGIDRTYDDGRRDAVVVRPSGPDVG